MNTKKEKIRFDKMINKYIKEQEVIKIERTVRSGDANILGIILNKSNDFLQLIELDDFIFNGQIIIRRDNIDSINCNESEITYKKILKKEGQFNKKKKFKGIKVDLTTWLTIFKDLKKKNIHVIIECENLKEPFFSIGPIEKINKSSIEIRYYNPEGQLFLKTDVIKYKNITNLKFEDRYSRTFRKYLKQPRTK